jgi:hypothetical protein
MGCEPCDWFKILSILNYFNIWLVLYWKTISLAFMIIVLGSSALLVIDEVNFGEWILVSLGLVVLKINDEYFGRISQVLYVILKRNFYYFRNEFGFGNRGCASSFIV